MFSLFILLTVVAQVFSYAEFKVYEDSGFDCCSWGCGTCEKFHVDDNHCLNFGFYDDKISSIDTHNTCIKIWEHRNCQGRYTILKPGDSFCDHADLSNCGWDNRVSSISDCRLGEVVPTTATTTPKPLPTFPESVECPKGTWVKEIRVKPGYKYGLELDCYAPGAESVAKTILAAKDVEMGRNLLTHCENEVMRGIYVSSSEAQGYCQYEHHSKFPYGTLCGNPKMAVCGIHLNKKGTAISSGGPICCTVPNPATSCIPSDRFQVIKECDNTRGITPMACSYRKTVGIAVSSSNSASSSKQAEFFSNFYSGFTKSSGSHSSKANSYEMNGGLSISVPNTPIGFNAGGGTSSSRTTGVSSELSKNFNRNYGKSQTTGFDWTSSESSSWNEETEDRFDFTVESGMKTRLEQVIGECGFMQVRTNYIRKSDFDSRGVAFSSSLSFATTTVSQEIDSAEVDK